MIIDNIITAVNLNKTYYDFIPIFIKSWKKLMPEIKVNIILISDHVPNDILEYKDNIILFNPIEEINTAFISQFIRILYPCLINSSNGVIITDIDMIPMNTKYYINYIKKYNDNKFICYRNILIKYKQLPICYNVATPQTWKEIFKINTIDDIINRIKLEYKKIKYNGEHGGIGWSTDQKVLYQEVIKWNKKEKRFIGLNDEQTNFIRLNRSKMSKILDDNIINKIKKGYFCDYHMLRPYEKYKQINEKILNLLLNKK